MAFSASCSTVNSILFIQLLQHLNVTKLCSTSPLWICILINILPCWIERHLPTWWTSLSNAKHPRCSALAIPSLGRESIDTQIIAWMWSGSRYFQRFRCFWIFLFGVCWKHSVSLVIYLCLLSAVATAVSTIIISYIMRLTTRILQVDHRYMVFVFLLWENFSFPVCNVSEGSKWTITTITSLCMCQVFCAVFTAVAIKDNHDLHTYFTHSTHIFWAWYSKEFLVPRVFGAV